MKIKKRRSAIHGWGIFASKPINKNYRIIDYAGEIVPSRIADVRDREYEKKGKTWIFQINQRWCIDGRVGGNLAKFLNHSWEPNCWVEILPKKREIWFRASRNIKEGEELTIDYGCIFPGLEN